MTAWPFPQGGTVVVDKPTGVSSHDVVARVRRVFATREVGHTGTLDPFASGVLVLVLGPATRCADLLTAGRKRYRAHIRLGETTDTDDHTGVVVERRAASTDLAAVVAALQSQTGHIMQTPPQYSAKHVDGQRAYQLARQGVAVNLAPAAVHVEAVEVVSWSSPDLVVDVVCGKGTYIRALARDVGAALGCGAHLTALRRTRVGPFGEDGAVGLDALQPTHAEPVFNLVRHMPHVAVDPTQALHVSQGKPFARGTVGAVPWGAGQGGFVVHQGHLLALAVAERALAPAQLAQAADVRLGRRFPEHTQDA